MCPAGASLGAEAASPGGLTVEGQLGAITVTDGRGGVIGWTTTVASTAFTRRQRQRAGHRGDLHAAPGRGDRYRLRCAHRGDRSVGPGAVQTATGVSGANTAAWDPGISVAVPAGARAALYTATITHSVA